MNPDKGKMSFDQFTRHYLNNCNKTIVTSDELNHAYSMYLWGMNSGDDESRRAGYTVRTVINF